MIARFLVSTSYLRLSPRQACQLVILGRSDATSLEGRQSVLHLTSEPSPELATESSKWPRGIFFIIGTLPAAIKLASFSGMPWTKAWGMMFVTSFVVIELFSVWGRPGDAEHPPSLPAILGMSDIEWEEPVNNTLRERIKSLTLILEFGDTLLFLAAMYTHIGLVGWAAWNLLSNVVEDDDMLLVIAAVMSTLAFWWMVLFFGGLLLKRIGRFPSGVNFGRWLMISLLAVFLTPEKRIVGNKAAANFNRFAMKTRIMLVLFGIACLCGQLMTVVCKKWPWVGRVLLVESKAWRPKGVENESEGRTGGIAKVEADPIDAAAWALLCLFNINVGVCALWYAFLYDSTRTVDPSWTDVFG
jgi:hypothetical protein